MIVSIAAAALAVQLSMTPGAVAPQATLLKPCNTVSPSIRRHVATAGI
jgi:hypothetical protein